MLGVSRPVLNYHVNAGNIPAPRIVAGKRFYYTPTEVEDIKAWWVGRGGRAGCSEMWSMTDVARELGTARSCLQYHVEAGNIPAPTTTLRRGTKNYYNEYEVMVIRQFWENRVPLGCPRFSEGQITEMRAMWAAGMRQQDIAERFGTIQENVSRYCVGAVLGGWRGGQTARAVRSRPERATNRRNAA